MRRVLFVLDTLESGGAQRSLVNFLKELDSYESNIEVDLLLFARRGVFLNQLPQAVCILNTPREISCMVEPFGSRKFISNICLRGFTGKIARLLGKKAFEIIDPMLNDTQRFWLVWRNYLPDLPGYYDVAVAGLEGVCSYYVMEKTHATRKVLWFHNNYCDCGYSAEFDHDYYAKADLTATISLACLQSLRSTFPDLSNRFVVLGNISNAKTIVEQSNCVVEDSYTTGSLNLLTIGRFEKQKGYDLLVDAASRLRDMGLNYVWRCIGDGSLMEDISCRIADESLADRVLLIGLRSNPYPYIKACDLFVQTSRYEGKSIVLDEAKLLCKPIVATNYATVRDSIEDGKTGIVCEMSGAGIAEAIMKLSLSNSQMNTLSRNLSKDFTRCGSSLEEYLSVYFGD